MFSGCAAVVLAARCCCSERLALDVFTARPCMCSVKFEDVEALFRVEAGYVGFRTVRRMCFVDFANERQATQAMRKHQGHAFSSSTPVWRAA